MEEINFSPHIEEGCVDRECSDEGVIYYAYPFEENELSLLDCICPIIDCILMDIEDDNISNILLYVKRNDENIDVYGLEEIEELLGLE